jgi:hypothetical protein
MFDPDQGGWESRAATIARHEHDAKECADVATRAE